MQNDLLSFIEYTKTEMLYGESLFCPLPIFQFLKELIKISNMIFKSHTLDACMSSRIFSISKIQLVIYYQSCVLTG